MRGHNAAALVGSVALLSLCIGAGGCATPYQQQGFRGGYSEVPLSDNSFLVQVNGNAYSSEDLLWSYLQRRAKELCVEQGFVSSRLESPGSSSAAFRSEEGYTATRTAPDTVVLKPRGFSYNKHQVEAVVVCSDEPPRRKPSKSGGEESPTNTPDVAPAEPLQ